MKTKETILEETSLEETETQVSTTQEPLPNDSMFVEDTPNIEVPSDTFILSLIRSSAPKPAVAKRKGGSHVYKHKTNDDDNDTCIDDTRVDDTRVDDIEEKPQKKKKWQACYELSPHIAAVRYVRRERVKAGLPAGVKEELANIEEESVRKELRSSRRLISSRKIDAKDKLHATECKTIEDYLDTKTFTRRIANEMWANKVAHELVEWIHRPRPEGHDPIKLTEFFMEKGIYHRDFHRLSKRYEILAQAADYALKALGCVRERNVLENKWNPTAGIFMMGHYDEDWAAEIRRREEAKQRQNISQTVDLAAIVRETIKPVAPTEEVRVKKEQDRSRE